MKHTKEENPDAAPLIASDVDVMRLGLQTLGLGIQYQIRTLQEQLRSIQERTAALLPSAAPVNPIVQKLLHVAPEKNGPRPKRPAELRAAALKANALPIPDIGTAKDGKRLSPTLNLRKVYQYALEHDGLLNLKVAFKHLKFKIGSRGSILRGGSFQSLFEPVPGEDRVYRLKKDTKHEMAPLAPSVKNARGIETALSGHGLLMFNWAIAHEGKLELKDFREHHRHLPAWQKYPQNMPKNLLATLTPVPRQKLVWQLKPEHLQQGVKT